jgi:hypothetical protein
MKNKMKRVGKSILLATMIPIVTIVGFHTYYFIVG